MTQSPGLTSLPGGKRYTVTPLSQGVSRSMKKGRWRIVANETANSVFANPPPVRLQAKLRAVGPKKTMVSG